MLSSCTHERNVSIKERYYTSNRMMDQVPFLGIHVHTCINLYTQRTL